VSDRPEQFTDDVQAIIDAAETGTRGCLLPLLDDTRGGGDDEGE
jgi:hypothetical protein